MKRLLPILLCLLLLTGCSAKPSIRPADLTKDEQALLRMFGQSYPSQVFDFTAPAGAVGLIIRRQQLLDGEWVTASHYLPVTEKTGRLAISFDDLSAGLHCAILQKGEVEANSAVRHETSPAASTMMTAFTTLATSAAAPLHTEVPLLMQLRSADNAMSVPGAAMADYLNAAAFTEYDEVYIVTAAFTDKPLQ